MNIWIFAGLCEKSDALLYLSSILAASGKRVLVTDATERGYYKYRVGTMDQLLKITQFGGFDVAIGFASYDALMAAVANDEDRQTYDIVLIDTDTINFCPPSIWKEAEHRIWVSDYTRSVMERSKEWLVRLFGQADFPPNLIFYKLFLNTVDCGLNDQYLWDYMNHYPASWMQEPFILPFDELHHALKLENEHRQRLRMKPLSRVYKNELCKVINELTGSENKISRRALKQAERRKA